MKKSTTPKVTLRYEQKNGSSVQNLYLDFYPPIVDPETGKSTRREFLRMQITPLLTSKGDFCTAKTGVFQIARTGRYFVYSPADTETLQTAQLYAQQRQADMYRADLLTDAEQQALETRRKGETPVLAYFQKFVDSRAVAPSTKRTWNISKQMFAGYLEQTHATDIRLKDIDKNFCDRYLQYLQAAGTGRFGSDLKHNTIVTYYTKFTAVLHDAYENEYIAKLPQMQTISMKGTERVFLEMHELQQLAQTDCPREYVKRAALFSALTGLRLSDVTALRWGDITDTENGSVVSITMQKTQEHIVLPVSASTLDLCGTRQADSSLVFPDMQVGRSTVNWFVQQWAISAGITKHISFHTFRHTFATLQLGSGTAITTIQQLMGHKSLATTQIYAKVLDSAKRAAADSIKLDVKL